MSLETPEALSAYVFQSDHTAYLRRRREWFERMDDLTVALWWVRPGHRPSVDEGVTRLDQLRAEGPSDEVFTFRQLTVRG